MVKNFILKIPRAFRIPIGISIAFHAVLLIVLMVELPSRETYRLNAQIAPVKIVNAVAVNSMDITAEMNKIKAQQQQKRAEEQARLQKLQEQALALKQQRLDEQKRVDALKQEQIQLKKAQALAVQKQRAAEQKKALILKQAQEKRTRELASKQKQLQQQLLQQQMLQEQQEISQAHAAQMQGILDQYKAQIIQAIQNRWIVPDDVDKSLSCVLLIRLAPGGVVLSVDTLKTSGDPILDRSARVAVFKASPLPAPQDPAVFEKFRELRLTVRPLQVVNQG